MIKTTDFLREYNKKLYFQNMLRNRQKKQRLYNKQVREYNKNNNKVFDFGIDKVYKLENLHKKINWYKYFLELYIVELLDKHKAIKNNKINL